MPSDESKHEAWTSKSLASSFWHKIFYAAIRFAGRRGAYCLLFFVVFFYTLRPSVRQRSAVYREKRFGKGSFVRSFWNCFRMHWEFGKILVDRAVMGILGEFVMTPDKEDKQQVADLSTQGKGLILLTAHVGCWQLGLSILQDIKVPLAVVMYKADSDVDRHYFEHQGAQSGPPFSVIDPSGPMGGMIEMMAVLQKGGVVCLMGDRTFGSQKGFVDVDFMGGRIALPVSSYKLASAMNAPIAVAFTRRTGPGRGRIWLSRIIRVPHLTDRETNACRPYAQEFANGLEEYVRKHPFQFFNFFNMWEKQS